MIRHGRTSRDVSLVERRHQVLDPSATPASG